MTWSRCWREIRVDLVPGGDLKADVRDRVEGGGVLQATVDNGLPDVEQAVRRLVRSLAAENE